MLNNHWTSEEFIHSISGTHEMITVDFELLIQKKKLLKLEKI